MNHGGMAAVDQHEAGSRARVLLVDDDDLVRGLVSEVLEHSGYVVVEASEGRQALEALAERRPDVIVLDLRMPGMDGLAFLAEQRRRGLATDVPTIVLSAAYRVSAYPVACGLAFLPKPFDPEALVAAIDELLAHPTGRGAPRPTPGVASP